MPTDTNWRVGYRTSWRVFRVDHDTWADAGLVSGVSSASVERSYDDNAPTLERGTMVMDAEPGEDFQTGYYRIAMTAVQDDGFERVDVATLLCETTDGDVNRGVDVLNVVGRSVLYPASTTQLESGSYAPAGSDGVSYVTSLLRASINAPIEATGSFRLEEHYVFDSGSTVLEAVWKILNAGSYTMQIRGDGTVMVLPMPTEPELVLDRANARLVHPSIHHEMDVSDVPNRYIVKSGGEEFTAVNDDPASVTSTVYRGWTSDKRDESPTRVNGETLAAYARRRLEEESMVYDSRSYTREYWPNVYPCSLVRGSIASVGLDGDLRVVSQTLTCGRGITVQEMARREVYTWTR